MGKYLGFFFSLLLPVVFWIDVLWGFPVFSVGLFFILLPALRYFWPIDFPRGVLEDELSSLMVPLSYLPLICCVVFYLSASIFPFVIDFEAWSFGRVLGVWVSFWIYASLSLAAAHDMIHRREPSEAILGRFVAAASGYIHFMEEHKSHHASSGRGHDPDCAGRGENVYLYAARTSISGFRDALVWSKEIASRKNLRLNHLWVTALIPAVFVGGYWALHGAAGLVFYLTLSVAVFFAFRVITYLQHWGLGDFSARANGFGYSWDSACIFQSWVTFNIALHDAHHAHPSRPYYLLESPEKTPLLPASYPVMFLLALIPGLLRPLMERRINEWQEAVKNETPFHQDEVCFTPELLLPRS